MEAIDLIELNQLYAAGDTQSLAAHPKIYLKPEWAMEIATNLERADAGDDLPDEEDAKLLPARIALAKNPALANLPEVAMKLAGDEDGLVAEALAWNPLLPQLPEVAMKLAKSAGSWVCETLAHNPALAELPEVALALSHDYHERVRSNLASNPAIAQLPAEVPLVLSYDPERLVRYSLDRRLLNQEGIN